MRLTINGHHRGTAAMQQSRQTAPVPRQHAYGEIDHQRRRQQRLQQAAQRGQRKQLLEWLGRISRLQLGASAEGANTSPPCASPASVATSPTQDPRPAPLPETARRRCATPGLTRFGMRRRQFQLLRRNRPRHCPAKAGTCAPAADTAVMAPDWRRPDRGCAPLVPARAPSAGAAESLFRSCSGRA